MRVLEKSWKFVSEKGYKPCNGKTSICGQFMCLAHRYFDFFIRLYHTDRSLFQRTHFDGMKLLPADLCLCQWILVEHHKVKLMKTIMVSLIVNMLFC